MSEKKQKRISHSLRSTGIGYKKKKQSNDKNPRLIQK